jgi:hypothetical protein
MTEPLHTFRAQDGTLHCRCGLSTVATLDAARQSDDRLREAAPTIEQLRAAVSFHVDDNGHSPVGCVVCEYRAALASHPTPKDRQESPNLGVTHTPSGTPMPQASCNVAGCPCGTSREPVHVRTPSGTSDRERLMDRINRGCTCPDWYHPDRHDNGCPAGGTPDRERLAFVETQRFYNAGFSAGARAACGWIESSVLGLPNEDRDGYEERWIKRSGVTGIIEIVRAEYAAGVHPAAPSLDMEALAEALDTTEREWRGCGTAGYMARVIAREYQRIMEERE